MINATVSAALDHIAKNWVAFSASAGVLFVAFVSCMPFNPPSTFAEYWQWVREALQTAIPAARHRQEFPANPQPPGSSTQSKKEEGV